MSLWLLLGTQLTSTCAVLQLLLAHGAVAGPDVQVLQAGLG